MRNYFFIFLFAYCRLSTIDCFAQQAVVDSLIKVVKTTKEDTVKVNALNELFLQYEFSDDKKAKECLVEAEKLSNKANFKKGLATTHIYLGYFSEDKADYSSAINHYQTSLKLFIVISDKEGILKAYNNIGNVFFMQSKYSQALSNYTECLKIGKEIGNQKGILNASNNIGLVWMNQGEYSKALPNFFVSLKVSKAIDNKPEIIKSYNYLGSIYSYQGNYNEALKYYLLGLKIGESIDVKKEVASSYNNLGNLYADMGNNVEALKYHKLSLEIRKALADKRGVAACYNNIGNVCLQTGNYDEALKYDAECIKIAEELQDVGILSYVYNNIGMVYYKLALSENNSSIKSNKLKTALENHFLSLKLKEERNDKSAMASSYNNIANVYFLQKEYGAARKYVLLGKKFSEETGYKDYLKDSYNQLSQLDSATGNFKNAYENHKMYILYRDSLDNEETRKKTIQSQMTYDFEKKEAVATAEHKKELENQEILSEEKSRKQKIVLALVSCFLLLVVIFAGFIFKSLRTTRKQKTLIEQQKNLVENQKQEVEHQKLLVEEHQKEIIDSITYARRIQRSLLPTEKYIEKTINRLMKK